MKFVITVLLSLLLSATYAAAEDVILSEEVFVELPSVVITPAGDYGIGTFGSEDDISSRIYSVIAEGLAAKAEYIYIGNFDISFTSENMQVLEDIFCSAVYNQPECAYLRTSFHIAYSSSSMTITRVVPHYLEAYDEDAFKAAADYAFSKAVAPGMTDIEKMLSIHDYLVDTITYSKDGDLSDLSTFPDSVFTPYGALVNGNAVCQGYALAFKLLCDRAGIEDCGYALTSTHIWNIVKLGDNYYHVDATHDDPTKINFSTGESTTIERVYHNHFLASDSQWRSLYGSDYDFWTTDRPECTDGTLYSSLNLTGITDKLVWRGDCFWYTENGFYLQDNSIVLQPTGNLYKYKSYTLSNVTAAEFLPSRRLSCEMFNLTADNKLAIDGVASGAADLYAVRYDSEGRISAVEKLDISFDAKGRGIARLTAKPEKVMLFSNDGQLPLAYTFE